ncbi:hormonally up-regulated neu tumor-associated kinase [Plakobranchus ocellatus]|uniref:Hormonally up-regulated neu tumor-associated kinase n=1 Tax=Plakobranchus ocellatus TaxID=259542 RepID=A0AAV3ZKT9_9GAST|nr:hormonally up-regulated neu tumor-associated kinase [Plakobranchus ocellatus]
MSLQESQLSTEPNAYILYTGNQYPLPVISPPVAIKIIDTRKLKEEYQKNNLQREARILGQLRHPNIVRLYETLKVRPE